MLSFVLQVLQGYAVTAVAWLYWSRYISSFMTRAQSEQKKEKPRQDSRASLKRLMGYMLPYTGRFIVVLALVVLSSYGILNNYILQNLLLEIACNLYIQANVSYSFFCHTECLAHSGNVSNLLQVRWLYLSTLVGWQTGS